MGCDDESRDSSLSQSVPFNDRMGSYWTRVARVAARPPHTLLWPFSLRYRAGILAAGLVLLGSVLANFPGGITSAVDTKRGTAACIALPSTLNETFLIEACFRQDTDPAALLRIRHRDPGWCFTMGDQLRRGLASSDTGSEDTALVLNESLSVGPDSFRLDVDGTGRFSSEARDGEVYFDPDSCGYEMAFPLPHRAGAVKLSLRWMWTDWEATWHRSPFSRCLASRARLSGLPAGR